MVTVIILVALLGVASFICSKSGAEFRGSSEVAKFVMNIVGAIGYLAYFVFLIWGFFVFPWWVPVLAFIINVAIVSMIPINMPITFVSLIVVPLTIVWLLFVYI